MLGSYHLIELLGEGAMGTVFRAERHPDGTPIALKVLKAELAQDAVLRQRFVREARAAREITHKHLLAVVDYGEAAGYCYLATDYVLGGSLAQQIAEQGQLPVRDTIRIASGVASALDALHERGLVHRDIKPSNILLGDSGALLADFGVVGGGDFTALTRSGHALGTAHYLAPELISGAAASAASDIYALGCVTYECLTGQPPFADRSVLRIGVAHLEDEPADPREKRPEIPVALSDVVLHALAKAPEQRPSSAVAYAHMLDVARRERRP
jgi:serine/threonine protein kinase